jgi:hypothetical protein
LLQSCLQGSIDKTIDDSLVDDSLVDDSLSDAISSFFDEAYTVLSSDSSASEIEKEENSAELLSSFSCACSYFKYDNENLLNYIFSLYSSDAISRHASTKTNNKMAQAFGMAKLLDPFLGSAASTAKDKVRYQEESDDLGELLFKRIRVITKKLRAKTITEADAIEHIKATILSKEWDAYICSMKSELEKHVNDLTERGKIILDKLRKLHFYDNSPPSTEFTSGIVIYKALIPLKIFTLTADSSAYPFKGALTDSINDLLQASYTIEILFLFKLDPDIEDLALKAFSDIISSTLTESKPGDSFLLPTGWSSCTLTSDETKADLEGHSLLSLFVKKEDGKLYELIFNTHHTAIGSRSKVGEDSTITSFVKTTVCEEKLQERIRTLVGLSSPRVVKETLIRKFSGGYRAEGFFPSIIYSAESALYSIIYSNAYSTRLPSPSTPSSDSTPDLPSPILIPPEKGPTCITKGAELLIRYLADSHGCPAAATTFINEYKRHLIEMLTGTFDRKCLKRKRSQEEYCDRVGAAPPPDIPSATPTVIEPE